MTTQLENLGWDLATSGIESLEAEVSQVVAHARRAGIASVAVSVLADLNQPAPARERAFSLVAASIIARKQPSTASPSAA